MESASCDKNDSKSSKRIKMDSTMLDCYTKIIADDERTRIDAGITLLRYLSQQKSEDTENKELDYALKRLIRGLGSSRMSSKKGFYTTLTAYLTLHHDTNIDDILKVMEDTLKTSGSNSKSENADIFMGRILFCGSLVRSKLLTTLTAEQQRKVVEIIFNAGTKRSYLSFVSISFLIDFISEIDEESLKMSIWPVLAVELGKSWENQTLDTFYALLVMNTKFPSLVNKKFLHTHLGSKKIIDSESMDNLLKLVTEIPRLVCYRHPLYKILCERLVDSGHVEEFWNGIDQRFVNPSRNMEHLGMELFNLIITNVKDKNVIPSLLSPNFLKYVLERFTSNKRNRKDNIAVSFKQALTHLVSALNDKEIKSKVPISVLKKLILHPGDLMIEKITGTRVVQMITYNMGVEGIKKISRFYADIVRNIKPKRVEEKEVFWMNAERVYAGQLMSRLLGHSAIIAEHSWRLEQLKLLFDLGLCETSNVSAELAAQLKESFYRALDHKLPKLGDLQTILSQLILHLNEELFTSKTKTLRSPLDESAIDAWKKMMTFITTLDKDSGNKEAVLIFYTMDMNMALQLFVDAEMAISSINEIHSCSERLMKKKASKKNKKLNAAEDEEPEWVEVIVDLLLSLLSKNNHLLRSLVKCVFPHVCPVLTASSVHQILSVLDPKDDKGPLVPKNAENDSDEEDDDEDSESEEESDGDANENEEDSESDMEVDEDDEDENETVTDQLRLAVRQALGEASAQTEDEDVDIDEITEEEGKRLDESLAAAFKILRENRHSGRKKQGKSAEVLTHFRVRVIDLLDIYLESEPSMAVVLDIIVPLFALLEFCIKDPHQKPLENRVRACLKKLAAVKKFKDTEGVDEKVLTDLARVLIEKGERSTAICQEMGDKLAECCTFLIRCVQQSSLPSDSLSQMFTESLTAFFKKRDCVLPVSLFTNILQLCWAGSWQLVPLIIDYIFDDTIRSFRRGQALELLATFYRNHRMIKREEYTAIRLKLEKKLSKRSIACLEELKNEKEVKQKFVRLLFKLLYAIYLNHIENSFDWKSIANGMIGLREQHAIFGDAKKAYKQLALKIGVPMNVTTQVKAPVYNNNLLL